MGESVSHNAWNQYGRARRTWVGRLIAALLVMAAAGVVVLLLLTPAPPKPAPEVAPTPVNVAVRMIEPLSELIDTLTLSAVVEPEVVVRVAAEVAGRVERYGLRERALQWRGREFPAGRTIAEGEPVEAGEILIHLNRELLQAAYDRAKAQYEYDEREYRRIADLFEREVTAKTEFDTARTRRDISRAALDEAERSLERTTIFAPTDGFLNRLAIEPGEYAVPGQNVAEIVALSRVKVAVDVPESEVHHLRVGDRAVVLARSPDQLELGGEIRYISELADTETRTSRVEIVVENPEHVLRSGQIVRARLTRRVLKDVIMIPLGSVIPLEEGRIVYVVNDDHAVRREVTLGLIEGREVEILEGLQAGDRLIVAGHRYVGPGQLVTVVSDIAASGQGVAEAPTGSGTTKSATDGASDLP